MKKTTKKTHKMNEGHRYNVYLDQETISSAKDIGDGNISLGLRISVKNMAEKGGDSR